MLYLTFSFYTASSPLKKSFKLKGVQVKYVRYLSVASHHRGLRAAQVVLLYMEGSYVLVKFILAPMFVSLTIFIQYIEILIVLNIKFLRDIDDHFYSEEYCVLRLSVIFKKKTVTLPSLTPDKQTDEKGEKLRLEDKRNSRDKNSSFTRNSVFIFKFLLILISLTQVH